uniref:G-protein coupled receptors family 1 profile domain-containing protein n=1 Tax=Acrobeloides nanus TaxID=290746 RepID=A0A914BY15_9BILA
MRTFTNILLTSLATADLLVGIVIMPLALLDLLHGHNWPFGRLLCAIWATSDVLLCTASILNLCIISLDRYLAITSPLKYTRTRSKTLAFGLLSLVWGISIIVCTPPWIVPGWGLFTNINIHDQAFACMYSPSVPYRIYSALGSFYIPLLIMLSMYFKIFKVASEREKLMRQSLGTGTCRLSRKADKQKKKLAQNTQHNRCASAPMNRGNSTQNNHVNHAKFHQSLNCKEVTSQNNFRSPPTNPKLVKHDTINYDSIEKDGETTYYEELGTETISASPSNHNMCIERESKSMVNLNEDLKTPPVRKNTEATVIPYPAPNKKPQSQLFAASLMATAHVTGSFNGNPVKNRGSKEKLVYLRERKALKTIGIVVLGFIFCWMPFFVIYLIEVFMVEISNTYSFRIASEFFLWLGYSNSVLNPLIYTMYNTDFRRCFRDLLTCGCLQIHSHRRTMSVRKLHQQSNVF